MVTPCLILLTGVMKISMTIMWKKKQKQDSLSLSLEKMVGNPLTTYKYLGTAVEVLYTKKIPNALSNKQRMHLVRKLNSFKGCNRILCRFYPPSSAGLVVCGV